MDVFQIGIIHFIIEPGGRHDEFGYYVCPADDVAGIVFLSQFVHGSEDGMVRNHFNIHNQS